MSSTTTYDPMGIAEQTRYALPMREWPASSGTIRVWTNITSPEVTAPLPRLPEPPRQIPARQLLAREGIDLPERRTWRDRLRAFFAKPQWKVWLTVIAVALIFALLVIGAEVARISIYTPVVSPDVPVETLVRAPQTLPGVK